MMNNDQPEADAPLRGNFTMIPDVVQDQLCDPYVFRLYCHLRRVIGEGPPGEGRACWQSTETLAAHCGMSCGKVSEAKRALVDLDLIRIEKRSGRGGYHDHITLVDVWDRNRAHFAAKRDQRAEAREERDEARAPSVQPVKADEARVHRVEAETARVHQVNAERVRVHQVKAMRSPGETNQIPSTQNPLTPSEDRRPDNDDKGSKDASQPGEVRRLVFALYAQEIGGRLSPFVRQEIGELLALCADSEVWREAFRASAGAERRWPYIRACIRNHAAGRRRGARGALEVRGTGARLPERGMSAGSATVPKRAPPPEHVLRWKGVLAALRGMLNPLAYNRLFRGSTSVGVEDAGRTWRVRVTSPLLLEVLAEERFQRVVARALRYEGAEGVTVRFVADGAEGGVRAGHGDHAVDTSVPGATMTAEVTSQGWTQTHRDGG